MAVLSDSGGGRGNVCTAIVGLRGLGVWSPQSWCRVGPRPAEGTMWPASLETRGGAGPHWPGLASP